MKWKEVRRIYPDQFVKLKILDYHIIDNTKIIDDMAIIEAIKSNKKSTEELVRSIGDEIVYNTRNEDIVIKIRSIRGYK